MRYPELIFVFIFFLIIVNIIIISIKYRKHKNIKTLVKKICLSISIIGFSFIWFVPIHIGYKGEAPICKFRFKIYTYESDDYGGYGNINDLFFKITPDEYGTMYFIEKKGDWQEYFNFTSLKDEINSHLLKIH